MTKHNLHWEIPSITFIGVTTDIVKEKIIFDLLKVQRHKIFNTTWIIQTMSRKVLKTAFTLYVLKCNEHKLPQNRMIIDN